MISRAKRKALALVLTLIALASSVGIAAADPWTEYTHGIDRVIRDPSLADQIERAASRTHYSQKRDDEEVGILAVEPGVGSTRIIIDRWSSGATYQDDEKYGLAGTIWNVTMTIAPYFAGTAGSVILDIAELFGEWAQNVDMNKGATSRLYHSYSYPDKLAQVWIDAKVWRTYYTSQSREWYRHEFASYTTIYGFTRSASRDFTGDLGYAPINTDYAPHYRDDSWLQTEAWRRWQMGLYPGWETF